MADRKDVVYMDFNATTPLASSVIDVIKDTLSSAWGNPSSSYDSGVKAKAIIQVSRENVSKMLNGNNGDVVFMSGGTEANNHMIYNAVEYFKTTNKTDPRLKAHIITSAIEHDSILNVLKHFQSTNSIDVTYVGVSDQSGHVIVDSILENIRDNTVLISIMMANNETGSIQPLCEITEKLKPIQSFRREKCLPCIYLHTDAAQAIGKIRVDVKKLGVDYLTVVGHKFYGPRIGALWVRHGCPFFPFLHGGGQESGKRAGTENTPMIAGLGEACRLVHDDLDIYTSHLHKMRDYLRERLEERFGEEIVFNNMKGDSLPNTLNISLLGPSLTGRVVLSHCKYLQASVGAACHSNQGDKPSSILVAHGVPVAIARNALRLSVGRETTPNEVHMAVQDLKQAVFLIRSRETNANST